MLCSWRSFYWYFLWVFFSNIFLNRFVWQDPTWFDFFISFLRVSSWFIWLNPRDLLALIEWNLYVIKPEMETLNTRKGTFSFLAPKLPKSFCFPVYIFWMVDWVFYFSWDLRWLFWLYRLPVYFCWSMKKSSEDWWVEYYQTEIPQDCIDVVWHKVGFWGGFDWSSAWYYFYWLSECRGTIDDQISNNLSGVEVILSFR